MHFVRHHRFAVARAAEDNPTLAFAARHRFRRRANEKRIIYGLFIKGAEVFYVVSERGEQLLHLFFVTKTGVIRAERNFHVMNLLPEVRGHCRGQPAFVIPSGSLALREVEPAEEALIIDLPRSRIDRESKKQTVRDVSTPLDMTETIPRAEWTSEYSFQFCVRLAA